MGIPFVNAAYVADRIEGHRFHRDPFADARSGFPWMTRDQVYGLTHIHFYNSDFGRHRVRYAQSPADLIEILAQLARRQGDTDLLLELLICYATTVDARPELLAVHDNWAGGCLETLEGSLGDAGAFAKSYHQCLVAWLYVAARRRHPAGEAPGSCTAAVRRSEALGSALARCGSGDPTAFLSDYAEFCERHAPHPAIEACLPVYGDLLAM